MSIENQLKFHSGLEWLRTEAINEAVRTFGIKNLLNKEIVFHTNNKQPKDTKICVWNLEKSKNKKEFQIQYITSEIEVYFNIEQNQLTIKSVKPNEQKEDQEKSL